jgi:hypothetical protein
MGFRGRSVKTKLCGHQGSIAAFKIMYRDERGIWDDVRWDGKHAAFFAVGETDEKTAMRKLRG